MSELTTLDPALAEPDADAEVRRPGLARLLRRPLPLLSVLVLLVVALLALVGPAITPYDPTEASITRRLQPPSSDHLLGTDQAGRDQLSRVVAATRLSVGSGLFTVATALVAGVGSGLVAGYRGGRFDTVATAVVSVLMALPAVVVLAAARAVFGPSLLAMMALLGLFLSPVYYRITWASVRGVRNELYVDAARVAGLSDLRIVGRHVLSAVRAPIIVQSSIIAGMSVALLAGLEFIGLGNPDNATWGSLLNVGFQQVYAAPWLVVGPAVVLSLTSMAFVLLGNALRDHLGGTAAPSRTRRTRPAAGHDADPPAADPAAAPPVVHPDPSDPSEPRAGEVAPLLSVRDLRVAFQLPDGTSREVVHGVSLDVGPGEVHGVIGESGSGKSVTALGVLGLLPRTGRVTGGEIVFDGTSLAAASERAMAGVRGRRIGYVPQEPMTNLDPSFTVGSQLTYPLVTRSGMTRREARERSLDLLARVGIPDPRRTFDSYPFEVSGGMAQRILIAGAVSMDPELLIADEPTTALDVTVQAEVLDLLRDLQQERHMAVLLVTHNVGVVADLCDRVTVMEAGRFVETGPVRSVLGTPGHAYTQALLGALLDDVPPRAVRDVTEVGE